MQTPSQLRLSEAWERAARDAELWEAWLQIMHLVDVAEIANPPLPGSRDELIKLLGDDWREKRRFYEDRREAALGPLTKRRAQIREDICEVLRENMLNQSWCAVGRPDDPLARAVDIEADAWHHFDLGAAREDCLIYPRYFRRKQTRRFLYNVMVLLSASGSPDVGTSHFKRLVLAIDKRMIPQTAVFGRQAELFHAINHHLALSLQASARQLNLPGELKSLSDDNRLAVLRHFLCMVLPELGHDVLEKMARELLERKLLAENLDQFSTNTLRSVASEALIHRIQGSKSSLLSV
jgi:hypothetical protein